MALINCPECNKEISDKASSCPNCGYPIASQESLFAETQSSMDSILQEIYSIYPNNKIAAIKELHKCTGNKIDECKIIIDSYYSAAILPTKSESILFKHNSFHATKIIGPIQVDENNKLFKIKGKIVANGKKDGLGKTLFKTSMAISTLGLSTLGNKSNKVGTNDCFNFEDLLNYELLENDSLVISGGIGQALISGAIFGGAGGIAGGITGKRKQKKKVESLTIKITLNNFDASCIMIPLITKPTNTDSKEYQTVFNQSHQILSILDVITHNK